MTAETGRLDLAITGGTVVSAASMGVPWARIAAMAPSRTATSAVNRPVGVTRVPPVTARS